MQTQVEIDIHVPGVFEDRAARPTHTDLATVGLRLPQRQCSRSLVFLPGHAPIIGRAIASFTTLSSVHAGEDVVLRYITRDGRPGMSWAARVVEDRADLVALHLPSGTPHKRWTAMPEGRVLADAAWRRETLRLMFPGRWHSTWLTWNADGSFHGYYVNLEEPFRRTAIGFDTNDHQLDIVVTPELTWSLKDEDVVADRLADGSFSAELVDAIRAEANQVVREIETRRAPFDGSWVDWRKRRPAQSLPRLHPRWNTQPPSQWERRLWAYPASADPAKSESG